MNKRITIERLPSVSLRIGLCRSSIYSLIASGELRPVKISGRAIGFLSSEVDDFIERRAALRELKVSGGQPVNQLPTPPAKTAQELSE